MTRTKTLISLVLVATSALLLAGCSALTTSNKAAGSLTDSSTPMPTAAATPAFNSGGYLSGNAAPTLPNGERGKISVLSEVLQPDDTGSATLLFTFRNNTAKAVAHVDFTGTATANGKVVATGQSQGVIPARVQPGEAGLGYIYFEDASSIPATGTTYDFTVSSMAGDASPYNTAPLTVTQATNNGTSIIGSAVNKTGKPLAGPYGVDIYCFNGNSPADNLIGYATQTGDITAGASVSFSVGLGESSCETYTVGVSGFFQ